MQANVDLSIFIRFSDTKHGQAPIKTQFCLASLTELAFAF